MIFGYSEKIIDEYGQHKLHEITIEASPDSILKVAKQLELVAINMKQMDHPSLQWHKHLPDELASEMGCDIIIVFPAQEEDSAG